ncbi:RING-H2 finger protein ATL78-like [Spinacia oleracea]|uniref:RING-type E3 ubiquitin transferase n=1 Tax=Spinacia oleracea TaxID=3562 RepID=A0A9R0IRG2_SPIOL|nr:RING-H2 finger protein ATL78-like [Spinacia oleracea]
MMPSTYSLISSNLPRRMLLHSPFFHHNQPATPTLPPPPPMTMAAPPPRHGSSIDANVVMIFSVLLCLLIFSICINCLIRCMFKCLIMITTTTQQRNNNLLQQHKEVVTSGVDKRALKTFPVVKYSKEVNVQGLGTECVICLSEFKGGDRLRILPKCHHGSFHVKCIDKWLSSQSSCPICRQSLVDTCHKIIGCDQQPTSSPLPSSSSSSEMVAISIVPPEREDLARNLS